VYIMAWSDAHIITLINLYEGNKMLWDTRCMEYRNKEAKDAQVAEFAAELNRTGMYFESNMNCECQGDVFREKSRSLSKGVILAIFRHQRALIRDLKCESQQIVK